MFRDCCLITRMKNTFHLKKDRCIVNVNLLDYYRFTIENRVNGSYIFQFIPFKMHFKKWGITSYIMYEADKRNNDG